MFDLPERLCQDRNRDRADRDFGSHVIRRQSEQLRRSLRYLSKRGLSPRLRLEVARGRRGGGDRAAADSGTTGATSTARSTSSATSTAASTSLSRCCAQLGWTVSETDFTAEHPEGRRAVFLGDLVDRGPNVPAVLRLAMSMVESGAALCVPGNHDIKLVRELRGRDVTVTHGLAESLAQLDNEPAEFKTQVAEFLDGLISHFVLDDGNLVVAHAGMSERFQGRASRRVRDFALFGETTGETDEFGLPVRYDWAQEYRGRAIVVYGHTPVPEAAWVNRRSTSTPAASSAAA